MTRFSTNLVAAFAAIFIAAATWTPVITVPADPVILGTATLA
ncbi:MAG: hypothetical protein R3D99_07775 [Altererythrobacter sp.]